MTITRDGIEIALTAEEMERAYWEQQRVFAAADIEEFVEQYGPEDVFRNDYGFSIDDVRREMEAVINRYLDIQSQKCDAYSDAEDAIQSVFG